MVWRRRTEPGADQEIEALLARRGDPSCLPWRAGLRMLSWA
jgi:hypothetical protein